MSTKTVYIVPPHVGENICVPNGSNVTFYHPTAEMVSEQLSIVSEDQKLADLLQDVAVEFKRAEGMYSPFASLHEGWAILEEEVEELWDEVKKSPKRRDPAKIREEAVQVAAMAFRFLYDLTEKQ